MENKKNNFWGWLIGIFIVAILAGTSVLVWRRAKREKIINKLLEKFAERDTYDSASREALRTGMKRLTDKELKLIETAMTKEEADWTAEEKQSFETLKQKQVEKVLNYIGIY